MYLFLIGLILCMVGIAMIAIAHVKIENATQEIIQNKKDYIDDLIQNKRKELDAVVSECDEACEKSRNRVKEVQKDTKQLIQLELKNAEAEINKKREVEELKLQQDLEKRMQELDSYYLKYSAEEDQKFQERKQLLLNQIEQVEEKLLEFQAKQEAVNQAILREKELKDKESFYSLYMSKNDRDDIALLQKMDLELHNRDVIPKLIWDLFIRRPAQEMIKRVTGGRDISGIYKITNKQTGESYIGKTTNISARWQNHLKTAIGLEGAAKSTLHTRLAADGIWNYTFEILEEVPKEQLSAREAFYIDLYGTKKQLNMKEGSKNETQ